jgi:hypothetical protein
LERVELRVLWENEAQHFTPWLAQEENLARLSNVLGLDLEFEATEQVVGPFKADILCKVGGAEDHLVLIENQLEKTDHTHLGQILTYASGLHAATVVWVAKQFTDEHRASLDWLNEKMAGRCNFFGLEIELWRIGDSPLAPKFNVISKPNDWTSRAQAALSVAEVSDTKRTQQAYWEAFGEYLRTRNSSMRPQKPLPQHWTNFAIGRSHFWMSATQRSGEGGWIAVELHTNGPNAKAFFAQLIAQKTEIERSTGFAMTWDALPGKKETNTWIALDGQNPSDRAQWPAQHAWLHAHLEKVHAAFRDRIRALQAEEPEEAEVQGMAPV